MINTNVLSYCAPNIGATATNVVDFTSKVKKPQENYSSTTQQSTNKISVKEGFTLFGKGMLNHIKDMAKSMVQHPVKTAISVATTSALLFALPLIGIPTVTAASVMALSFAGFSVCKGALHLNQFIKNNKNQDYDKARSNLSQLGADTLDLAMSAPAVPKAVKNVSQFAKYGKIAVNKTMINEISSASGIKNKIGAVKASNSELIRSMNYQAEVDKALLNLSGCTDAQKAEIKRHLLEFNVPDKKIPEVVLKKYAEITGVKTLPEVQFVKFEKDSVLGMASGKNCRISIKDDNATTVIPASRGNGPNGQRYKRINRRAIGNEYEYTYEDLTTGKKLFERVNKDIIENYTKLSNETKDLSPQASMISTTVHERRHIHQYARIIEAKGKNYYNTTPEATRIYSGMISDMPPVQPGSSEANLVKSWISGAKGIKGLIGTYLADPMEVDARNIQAKAVSHPEFKMLDGIYKQMNKIVPEKILSAVLPNYVKAQSVVASQSK